jgi:hypothetical protein
LTLSTAYPQFIHSVIQIIIRSLVLKVLADRAFVCYDSNIPINNKTGFCPQDFVPVLS